MQTAVVNQVLTLAHQAVKESHRDRLQAYIQSYARGSSTGVAAGAGAGAGCASTGDARSARTRDDDSRREVNESVMRPFIESCTSG